MVPWGFAGLAIAAVAIGTIFSVGPLPVIALALFLLSSYTLGARIVRESMPLATLIGVGLYSFLMTALSFFPVNYPIVWAAILIAPILLDWRSIRQRARDFRPVELRPWSERCAAAFFAFVLMMHWLVVLGPEKSADGLGMHLAVAANIAHRHRFTLQPAVYVWSVMPKGADYAYSIAYLLGGEFAARLLNLAMLLLLGALLYRALRTTCSRAVSLFLAGLFATTPLVQLVTGSLFVENMLAAMVFGTFLAIWTFGDTGRKRFLYAAALLAGAALATKLWAAVFLAVGAPFILWEIVRRKALKPAFLALLLALAIGLPPYAIAAWKTGNPIYPFKNEKLHSPLLDPAVIFQDNEFRQPLTWRAPLDLAFHTHLYYEGQNGTLGFQYLLFLPLGLLALLTKSRRAIASFVIATGGSILVLSAEPNVRYLYSALPFLFVPFGALLTKPRPALLALAIASAALNLYFLPGSSWYHKDFHVRSPFSAAARESYMRENIPIRSALLQFNRAHPSSNIFLANDEDIADPLGDVYEGGWHQYNHLVQLRQAKSLPALTALLEEWDVHYIASRKTEPGEQRDPPLMADFLERCTALEYQIDQIRVSRLETCRE
jgi:Dolichyl-phosphate-mannose-protein mannosyltransferase